MASARVTIGAATAARYATQPTTQHLVPRGYLQRWMRRGSALRHLEWMLAKEALGQDVFLIGPPGPQRRQLVCAFAELLNREVEWLTLSRDTTESDLKQRRQLVRGSVVWEDAAPTRAALHGRLLVLEGMERSERGILPLLNNLLENREMALEDGRFLVSHARRTGDTPAAEGGAAQRGDARLMRVHPSFRVCAIDRKSVV